MIVLAPLLGLYFGRRHSEQSFELSKKLPVEKSTNQPEDMS
jgi:hypothetical protein